MRASLLDSGLWLFLWGLASTVAPGGHQLPQLWALGSWYSLGTDKVQSSKSWDDFCLLLPKSPHASLAMPGLPGFIGHTSVLLVPTVPHTSLPSKAIRLGEDENKLCKILHITLYLKFCRVLVLSKYVNMVNIVWKFCFVFLQALKTSVGGREYIGLFIL